MEQSTLAPSTHNPSLAVLLFARGFAREEKSYGLGRAVDQQAHEAMLRHAVETAGQTASNLNGVDFLVAHDGRVPESDDEEARFPQSGTSFEHRFRRAFGECFARGYDRVVAIGGDLPDLQGRELERALLRSSRQRIAVGPAEDGGFYLLSLTPSQLGLLDGLPWQTPRAFDELVGRIRQSGLEVSVLRSALDVDSEDDALARLVSLLRLIRTYIDIERGTDQPTDGWRSDDLLWPPSYLDSRTNGVRGPP